MKKTVSATAALCMLGVTAAFAQAPANYPVKTVRVIVPFAPGGGSDFIARAVAPSLSKSMGQQFVVIRNMPTPGSQAHAAQQARLAKKGKLPKNTDEVQAIEESETPRQRTQPTGKTRAKKGKK